MTKTLLFFIAIFFTIQCCVRAQSVPSEWTCPDDWYGSGDGCDCNCGAQDPDCNVNINTKTRFLPTPEDNYWATRPNNGTHDCSLLCDRNSMICKEGKCYGVCNKQDFLAFHDDVRRIQILSIINSMLVGLLILAVFAIMSKACTLDDQLTGKTSVKVSDENQQLPSKSSFARYILMDCFRKKRKGGE